MFERGRGRFLFPVVLLCYYYVTVAMVTVTSFQFYYLHPIQLPQRRGFAHDKYFSWSMSLFTLL